MAIIKCKMCGGDMELTVYERIVQEDDSDAEAHWCCALCRFGIEYVKDPASGEYLPTCHRASFDSFLKKLLQKIKPTRAAGALTGVDAIVHSDGDTPAPSNSGRRAVSRCRSSEPYRSAGLSVGIPGCSGPQRPDHSG